MHEAPIYANVRTYLPLVLPRVSLKILAKLCVLRDVNQLDILSENIVAMVKKKKKKNQLESRHECQ